jgi:4-oxalocrotonate tautomerase
MPIVKINWAQGRSVEQKRKIAERITNAFVEVANVKPEAVIILFVDMPQTNIAKSGKLSD